MDKKRKAGDTIRVIDKVGFRIPQSEIKCVENYFKRINIEYFSDKQEYVQTLLLNEVRKSEQSEDTILEAVQPLSPKAKSKEEVLAEKDTPLTDKQLKDRLSINGADLKELVDIFKNQELMFSKNNQLVFSVIAELGGMIKELKSEVSELKKQIQK